MAIPTPAKIRFLIALANSLKTGAVKRLKQALDFAKREFGEVDDAFFVDILNVFKKQGKTKKSDVVPIKKKEGTALTEAEKDIADIQKSIDDLDAAEAAADADAAKEIVKKRTEDIRKGDVEEVVVDDLETSVKKLKEAADELKKVADEPAPFMEIAEGPKKGKKITIDDFFEMTGATPNPFRDPKVGMVRTAAREILEKNKIKIGREDPIEILRKTYGESVLEAVDAIGDDLLNTKTYGEVNELLKKNNLFDLVPKKTYGYDQSVVTAEKIRKAKEQEAKNKRILDEFDIDPDRQPNAYGGIAGTLRLNRTGFDKGTKKRELFGVPWKTIEKLSEKKTYDRTSPFSIPDDWLKKFIERKRKKKEAKDGGLISILKL